MDLIIFGMEFIVLDMELAVYGMDLVVLGHGFGCFGNGFDWFCGYPVAHFLPETTDNKSNNVCEQKKNRQQEHQAPPGEAHGITNYITITITITNDIPWYQNIELHYDYDYEFYSAGIKFVISIVGVVP